MRGMHVFSENNAFNLDGEYSNFQRNEKECVQSGSKPAIWACGGTSSAHGGIWQAGTYLSDDPAVLYADLIRRQPLVLPLRHLARAREHLKGVQPLPKRDHLRREIRQPPSRSTINHTEEEAIARQIYLCHGGCTQLNDRCFPTSGRAV